MILFLSVIFFIIAGIAEGVMDTLQFHYQVSKFKDFKNHLFWDPYHSWRNKYKNGNPEEGERFRFSTTLLVGFTDAWHFFKLLRNLSIFIAVFTLLIFGGKSIATSLLLTALLRVVFGFAFTTMYRKMGV
jgi:hypothetical protein